jgi:hypothetical protein
MGKTEEKLTLQAMERERKKREAKGKKKISYRYDHIKDLDKEVRAIKMNKGGDPMNKKKKSFPDLNKDAKVTKKDVLIGRGVIKKKDGGGVARGMGAATQGARGIRFDVDEKGKIK